MSMTTAICLFSNRQQLAGSEHRCRQAIVASWCGRRQLGDGAGASRCNAVTVAIVRQQNYRVTVVRMLIRARVIPMLVNAAVESLRACGGEERSPAGNIIVNLGRDRGDRSCPRGRRESTYRHSAKGRASRTTACTSSTDDRRQPVVCGIKNRRPVVREVAHAADGRVAAWQQGVPATQQERLGAAEEIGTGRVRQDHVRGGRILGIPHLIDELRSLRPGCARAVRQRRGRLPVEWNGWASAARPSLARKLPSHWRRQRPEQPPLRPLAERSLRADQDRARNRPVWGRNPPLPLHQLFVRGGRLKAQNNRAKRQSIGELSASSCLHRSRAYRKVCAP